MRMMSVIATSQSAMQRPAPSASSGSEQRSYKSCRRTLFSSAGTVSGTLFRLHTNTFRRECSCHFPPVMGQMFVMVGLAVVDEVTHRLSFGRSVAVVPSLFLAIVKGAPV